MLIGRLLPDSAQTFCDVNPGCVLGDFMRWCSSDEDYKKEMDMDEGAIEEVGH